MWGALENAGHLWSPGPVVGNQCKRSEVGYEIGILSCKI